MPLTHEAFFYSSDKEFAARFVPFLREAVASDQGAIAVATEPRIEALRRGLDSDADAVSFFDANRWYRRPGAALVAWRDALEQQLRDGSGFTRAVGEIPYGDDAVAVRNWARYESLVNRAFAPHPVWIACAYNTATVPQDILAEIRRTHPVVSTSSTRAPSAPHFGAHELGAALGPVEDRVEWQESTRVTVTGVGDSIEVRRAVRWEAQSAGLAVDIVDDLLLAVSELLRSSQAETNGAIATIRTARQDGEWFCEITFGRSQSDALSPGVDDLGLLIGRVISDRVEIGEDPNGSVVRFVFGTHTADPRQRIVNAASELFRADGVRTTGVNAIIARADVAKATFYAHFRSKDDLIRLWLSSPTVRWYDHVLAEVDARTQVPVEKLTTFFDVLGDWLDADKFHGCPFINTATEFRDAEHGFAQELLDAMGEVEAFFRRTTPDAGFADPDAVAEQLFLLVPGTITTAAARGSTVSARVARAVAASLIASGTPQRAGA